MIQGSCRHSSNRTSIMYNRAANFLVYSSAKPQRSISNILWLIIAVHRVRESEEKLQTSVNAGLELIDQLIAVVIGWLNNH
jgi:hypothetical protein